MVRNLTHSLRAETSKHSFKSPGCDGSTLDSNCNKYAVMAATYAVLNWIEQLNHMLMVVNNKKVAIYGILPFLLQADISIVA